MQFNKVTWYSIAMAIIIYVGTFLLAFWLGMQVSWVKYSVVAPQIPASNAQGASNK